MPGGQPFGVDPVGVAVAAQHRQRYARPWRRSAWPRADPQLPHRMVPALPAVRAVRLHDYADIGISRTYGTRSPWRSVGRCAFSWKCQVVKPQHIYANAGDLWRLDTEG